MLACPCPGAPSELAEYIFRGANVSRFRLSFPRLIPVLLAATFLAAGQTGIKEKKPVFGGACRLCPWGAMAEVVQAAMKPYGYDVQICYNCNAADAPRIVSEAQNPAAVPARSRRARDPRPAQCARTRRHRLRRHRDSIPAQRLSRHRALCERQTQDESAPDRQHPGPQLRPGRGQGGDGHHGPVADPDEDAGRSAS